MTTVLVVRNLHLVDRGRHRLSSIHPCHAFSGDSGASLYDSIEVVDVVVSISVESAQATLLVSDEILV